MKLTIADAEEMLKEFMRAYPKSGILGFNKEENRQVVAMWYKHFSIYERQNVFNAVDSFVGESEYPPTIASLKKMLWRL